MELTAEVAIEREAEAPTRTVEKRLVLVRRRDIFAIPDVGVNDGSEERAELVEKRAGWESLVIRSPVRSFDRRSGWLQGHVRTTSHRFEHQL